MIKSLTGTSPGYVQRTEGHPPGVYDQRGVSVRSSDGLRALSAATTVRGLGAGRDPPGAAPLRRVRGGVCRLLPGPGPLLRLGRQDLLPVLCVPEEVSTAVVQTINGPQTPNDG